MKKIISLFAMLFFVCALNGCVAVDTKAEIDNETPAPVQKQEHVEQEETVQENTENEDLPDDVIVEIPIESMTGITQKEAEELCFFVMGEKDEATGFPFSFGVSGAVRRGDARYYVVRATWLVDNSHMSYIGDFFVSADGKEVYSGTAIAGEYEIVDKVWSE